MPRKPHDKDECDEDCRGCYLCYVGSGDTKCDYVCKHVLINHPPEDEEEE